MRRVRGVLETVRNLPVDERNVVLAELEQEKLITQEHVMHRRQTSDSLPCANGTGSQSRIGVVGRKFRWWRKGIVVGAFLVAICIVFAERNNRTTPETLKGTGINPEYKHRGIDLYIIGWPKCGTTSLMYWLASMDTPATRIVVPRKEVQFLSRSDASTKEVMTRLDDVLDREEAAGFSSSTSPRADGQPPKTQKVLYGLKFPGEIFEKRGVERLMEFRNKTRRVPKLIVGLRNPVLLIESFYNYRLMEVHNRDSWIHRQYTDQNKTVPPPPKLADILDRDWLGVGEKRLRYNFFLQRLSSISTFQTFLYAMEQLEDDDLFPTSLQSFLEIENELGPLPKSNVHSARIGPGRGKISKKKYGNSSILIDICEEEHSAFRRSIISNGNDTADWILSNFLKLPNVVVAGNRSKFERIIRSYADDPC